MDPAEYNASYYRHCAIAALPLIRQSWRGACIRNVSYRQRSE
jgi:hypothetical protein